MPLMRHLRETEPFCHLPEPIFESFRAGLQSRSYPANTFIFQQNDPPTGFLYIIQEGLVEITVLTPGGVDMVVDYRSEGTFFGGTPIFTGEPYTAGARTVKPTECFLIPAKILAEASRDYPQISAYFTRIVLSRVRNLYQEIVTSHSQSSLGQMEAFPFKKRLSELMTTPVESCDQDEPVRRIARRLTDKGIGSVLVVGERQTLAGIVTERDLVTKVLAPEHADPNTLRARDIMTPTPLSMPPATYMYEAIAFMQAHRIKHLPVVDRGEPVGMVSLRDLMRFRSQKALLLLGSIREAKTLEVLAQSGKEILTIARSLLSETHSTPEVMEIVSHIHHAVIRRTFDLCLAQMQDEGRFMPDIRFCFLIMGSGGRREMLLGPDQDNGFIFEDVADGRMPEIEGFFAPFGEKLVAALAQVGYPLCVGKVMVNNPHWRGRLQDWQERIRDWVNEPEPQKVRYSSIFFDFVPLAGDPALAARLRAIVHREIREFQGFLYHMMSLDLRHRVPLGLLGRFVVEKSGEHKGMLSLKQGGSVFIVDCIRMFALERELDEVTTLGRLKALVTANVFAQETAEHIRAAFEALSFLRLRNEIDALDRGEPPSHFLDPYALTRNEQDLLKESFNAVSKLQDATKRHFGRTPF